MSGTGTEVETPAVATVEAAPVPAVVETSSAGAPSAASTRPATPDWVQPRIDTLTREKDDLRRQLAEAKAAQ